MFDKIEQRNVENKVRKILEISIKDDGYRQEYFKMNERIFQIIVEKSQREHLSAVMHNRLVFNSSGSIEDRNHQRNNRLIIIFAKN